MWKPLRGSDPRMKPLRFSVHDALCRLSTTASLCWGAVPTPAGVTFELGYMLCSELCPFLSIQDSTFYS